MVAKKRKSKRQTLKQKYKIQERTKEHHRKLKNGKLGRASFKKKAIDRIPNAWPYKEELLNEIRVAKDRMEEMKQRQKEKRLDDANKRRLQASGKLNTNDDDDDVMDEDDDEDDDIDDDDMKTRNKISSIANSDDEFDYPDKNDNTDGTHDIKSTGLGQNSRRAYLKELRKVVERADVILNVLDARDPIGTKSLAIEEMVMSDHRKKLVYVLNKADLVPREVLAGWLVHLRKTNPTLPFKSNTQSQRSNLGRATGKVTQQQESALQTNQAVGADELLGLLKNYCRVSNSDTKTIISVGIVGFPNVGKSSLINSLMRTRSVGVSSMPGFTKVSQEVILDKNIRLIDSPGIVFADGDSTSTALRNCVNVEELEDVYTPIQAILEKCPQQYLMQLYSISKFKAQDAMAFLALVARSTGKLKKGGIPNVDAAARSVLHDWNDGKIKFYCKPPVPQASGFETKVVNSFSKELDIYNLQEEDIRVLDAIEATVNEEAMDCKESYVGIEQLPMSTEKSFNDLDDSKSERSTTSKVSKRNAKVIAFDGEEPIVPDIRKVQKQQKKKKNKDLRRQQTGDNGDEDYDFNEHF
jgi:nuclear GTP-binding protein